MALLGVVASISVLGRQREEDCHGFEPRQAPYSQRGGDTILCESTHEVLVLSAELVHLFGFLSIRVMSDLLTLKWVLAIQTLASYLPGKHLTQ